MVLEDSGIYTCRVSNEAGHADSSAQVRVDPRASILESTSQHPESLKQIRMLEDYTKYQRNISIEEYGTQSAPELTFVKPLNDLETLNEIAYAHLETKISPVSDQNMRNETVVSKDSSSKKSSSS